MKRWHKEAAHALRESRKHLRKAHNWPKEEVDCVCDTQIGRFRKTKGLGCPKGRKCICKWGGKEQDLQAEAARREVFEDYPHVVKF